MILATTLVAHFLAAHLGLAAHSASSCWTVPCGPIILEPASTHSTPDLVAIC
jgi:hypothetical protein